MNDFVIKRTDSTNLKDLEGLFVNYRGFYGCQYDESEDVSGFLEDIILDCNKGSFFIAYLGDIAVGFAGCYFTYSSVLLKKIAIINDLFISDEYRSRGFGRSLIESAIANLKDDGFSKIRWCSQRDNLTAQALYDNMNIDKSDWIHYDLK